MVGGETMEEPKVDSAPTSILKTVRGSLGLGTNDASFDHEIIIHVNNALAVLNQNGVGLPIIVTGEEQVWDDFKDPTQNMSNTMFEQSKMYVFIKTKILFDPPPPSNIKYMAEAADETLWRLRETYDKPREVVITDEQY